MSRFDFAMARTLGPAPAGGNTGAAHGRVRGFSQRRKRAISGAVAPHTNRSRAPMSLDELTSKIREKVGTNSGLDATVKFDLGDAGVVFVDGKSTPNSVSNDDKDADCTISMTLENFLKLVAGDLDPTTAYMFGKLKIAGSMGVAMKLSKVI
jgi:putative sterol carrier protein